MSTIVECGCGKRYRMAAESAAKTFRCRACGAVLAAPSKSRPSAERQMVRDGHEDAFLDVDLDADDGDDAEGPLPPKRTQRRSGGTKPAKKRKVAARAGQASGGPNLAGARSAGIYGVIMGLLILLLPLFGLQFRRMRDMPQGATTVVGLLVLAIGAVMLGTSRSRRAATVATDWTRRFLYLVIFAMLGIAALAVVLMIVMLRKS